MTLDTTARAAALKLIDNFGATVTYTAVTAGAYNPATGAATPTTASTTVKAVPEVYSGDKFFSNLITAGDRKFICPASSFTVDPKPGDIIRFQNADYTIVAVKPVYGGELAAIYEIAARK